MRNRHLTALVILLSTSARADDWKPVPIPDVEMNCFQEKEPVEWSFCVNTVPSSKNNDVIYHFHGRNGAANWWNDKTYYTGEVHAKWLEKGIAPPTVVTVSFGKLFLLTERPDQKLGGLFRIFMDQAMARVEKEIPHHIERRSLVGESMGGMNTLMLAFKTDRRFSKAAALCTPLQTISSFASLSEIYHYYKSSSMSLKRLLMQLFFSRKFYPTEETWENNDPLQVAKHYKQPPDVSIYLTCGEKDEWGCMEGNKALVKTIRDNGGKVEWFPRPGGHCDIDVNSLAEFLVK